MNDLGCVEAEAALLGAALLAPTQAADTLHGVVTDDFTDPRHRDVYDAVRRLLDAGTPPDPVTVLGELRRHGNLPSTADRTAGVLLADLLAACPIPAATPHYRRVVMEHTYRRRVRFTADRLHQAAASAPLDDLTAILCREVADLLNLSDRHTAPVAVAA